MQQAEAAGMETPSGIDFQAVINDELERTSYDSYTNLNPNEFHANEIGYSPRQMYIRKLGLDSMDAEGKARCRVGSWIHDFIEDAIANAGQELRIEEDVTLDIGDAVITGRFDAYDPEADVVYDFKSRSGFYNFDPPVGRHVDQLLAYMYALDAQYGQVVYVSKKDFAVRTWPKDGPFRREQWADEWSEVVNRVHRVRDAILEDGVAMADDEIPFEKDGSWLSDQEELVGWL